MFINHLKKDHKNDLFRVNIQKLGAKHEKEGFLISRMCGEISKHQ